VLDHRIYFRTAQLVTLQPPHYSLYSALAFWNMGFSRAHIGRLDEGADQFRKTGGMSFISTSPSPDSTLNAGAALSNFILT